MFAFHVYLVVYPSFSALGVSLSLSFSAMLHCRTAVDNKSSFERYLIRRPRRPTLPSFHSNYAPLLATLETVAYPTLLSS